MRLIVQKYGGTSVANPERIRNVAKRIVETQREDCRVVAIISAMAGVTDELIKLAHEMSPDPDKRELDVLLATGENAATALTAIRGQRRVWPLYDQVTDAPNPTVRVVGFVAARVMSVTNNGTSVDVV